MIYPEIKYVNNFPYILNKKTSISIIIWINILIISFIIFIIVLFNYKYNSYETYLGYVKNKDLVLYVKKDNLNILYDTSLLIEKEKFDFKVKNISEEYYLFNNENYFQVIIEVNLKKEWLIENNILNIIFEKKEKTLYERLKKGWESWKK